MAINDFSNQNIQDTYQRVVQTDGTNRLADGTGSIFIPISSSHAITASHALFAVSASHEVTFELSSSHAVNADTASFATNFTASGNISASGTSLITAQDLTLDRDLVVGNNISASGDIMASRLLMEDNPVGGIAFGPGGPINFIIGNSNVPVQIKQNYLTVAPGQTDGHITASGNISASGDLYVNGDIGIGTDSPSEELEIFKTGENAQMAITRGTDTQLKLKAQDNQTRITYEGGPLLFDRDESGTNTLTLGVGGDITASGNISASATSFIQTPELKGIGTTTGFEVDGYVSASEFIAQGNITASGDISSSGTIIGTKLHAKNTDLGAAISLFDADDNAIANLARLGTGTNAHIGRMVLRDNANVKVDIRASGNSYIDGTSAKLGIGTNTPTTTLHVAGDISASNMLLGNTNHVAGQGELLALGNGDQGAKIKLFSRHATGNRAVVMEFSASGDHQNFTIGLNRGNDTFGIAPGEVITGNTVFDVGIEGDITASGDISSSGTIIANAYVGLPSGIVSSSDQIATPISGAFVAPSASFSTRVTANDAKVSYTDAAVTSVINTAGVLSSSAQLPTGIISSSLQDLGSITASGDISASGNIIAPTFIGNIDAVDGDFDGTLEADAITIGGTSLADVITGTTVDNATLAGSVTVTDSTADAETPVVFHNEVNGLRDDTGTFTYNAGKSRLSVPFISLTHLTASGNIRLDGHLSGSSGTITASGDISASGNIQANNFYGYQISVHPSNFTVNLNGSYYYLPLTGQSTGEHATSNSNERIPLVNSFNGHAIKTSIRSTNNAALNGAKITCSIFFEPPFNNGNNIANFGTNAPGSVAPGNTNNGHILWAEVREDASSQNHNAVHIDWRNPFSGSFLTDGNDIPSGSRVYLAMKSDHDGSVAYVVSTTFAWNITA